MEELNKFEEELRQDMISNEGSNSQMKAKLSKETKSPKFAQNEQEISRPPITRQPDLEAE